MSNRLSGAILAAGSGQRLRGASGHIPKPLVDLGGRPLLLRQVDVLIESGVSPIHAIVNSETHRLTLERELRLPDSVDLVVRDTPNSLESLLILGERIAPPFFLLMTVDAVLFANDVGDFVTNATKIAANLREPLGGALGVVQWRGDDNPLFVHIEDGVVRAFGEPRSAKVTAGIYLLSTAIFAHADEARGRGLDAMRRFLAMLLDKGITFAAIEVPRAIDIDYPADLSEARNLIARKPE